MNLKANVAGRDDFLRKDEEKTSLKLYILLFSVLVLVIAVILVMYVGFDQKEKSYDSTGTAMGTYVQQTVYGDQAEAATIKASNDINRLENLISWRIASSEIGKINEAAGKEWIDVTPKTLDVLLMSVDVASRSAGAFDPTILPVSSLWDFGGENQRVPSVGEITDALYRVDYKNIKINTDVQRVRLSKELEGIDLGAVGKGTACETAVEAYEKAGADCGIIAVGGSVGVYGTKPNKSDWRIAIRDPFKSVEDAESMGILKIKSGFVSTSGAYEKNFTQDGTFYHHILDPKTGYPVKTDLVSVTVYHKNGTMTDLLSTACYVLGKENSRYLLDYYGAGAVFVDSNKNVYVTDAVKDQFILTNNEYTVSDWK